MKRKFVTLVVTLLVLIGGLFVTSCAIVKDETGTHIRLSPGAHKTIGDAGKAGVDILGILSMFIPTLVPITAAAGAGVVTWNRMGKKVTKYKTPLEHLVFTLEDLKKDEKLWALVKPYLKGTSNNQWSIPSAKTETTIRELIDKNDGAT